MDKQFFNSFNAHVKYLYEPTSLTNKAYDYITKKLSNKKTGFLIWQTLVYEKNKFRIIKNKKARDQMVYDFLCLGLEVMDSLILRFGEPEFEEILKNFKEHSDEGSKALKNIS